MKLVNKTVIALIVFTVVITLTACSKKEATDSLSPSKQSGETEYPLTITDFLGREIVVKKVPMRIVSLAPSTTEILFELGLDERIVGVTDYDNYPEKAKTKPKVGGFKGPNLEAVVAQNPDLVFASRLSGQEQMEMIEKLGIPVVMLEAGEISRINDTIKLVSRITNTPDRGEQVIKFLNTRLAELSDKLIGLTPTSVYYIVDLDNNITAGRGTFIHELINLAGGSNAADDVEGWAKYSLEMLVEKNPDVIITSTHTGKVEDLRMKAGFRDLAAVKNNKVFVIEDSNIISRPSHRIVLGLEELIRFLHPEVLK